MYKPALAAGALLGCLAVILGAFGAHGLKHTVPPDMLEVFEKGVQYQYYHTFALLACGVIYQSFPNKPIRLARSLFIAGVLLFCGSLYAMALLSIGGGDYRYLGAITPVGGLCFIAGWLCLFAGIIKPNGK